MDLWVEILAARAKAHTKHGTNSIESIRGDDPRWLSILVEEIGEVAHAQTYDADNGGRTLTQAVRAELVDVAAVVTAWIDSIDWKARIIEADAPLGYLSGPPGLLVRQYESGPVPAYPEGGEDTEHDEDPPDAPECSPGCRQGDHDADCAWYDWKYPETVR